MNALPLVRPPTELVSVDHRRVHDLPTTSFTTFKTAPFSGCRDSREMGSQSGGHDEVMNSERSLKLYRSQIHLNRLNSLV